LLQSLSHNPNQTQNLRLSGSCLKAALQFTPLGGISKSL
jgi:hypothetical protein